MKFHVSGTRVCDPRLRSLPVFPSYCLCTVPSRPEQCFLRPAGPCGVLFLHHVLSAPDWVREPGEICSFCWTPVFCYSRHKWACPHDAALRLSDTGHPGCTLWATAEVRHHNWSVTNVWPRDCVGTAQLPFPRHLLHILSPKGEPEDKAEPRTF